MRKLLFLSVVSLSFIMLKPAAAQQDAQYSMYMFNGLAVNPAYAGSRDALSLLALYRHQWTGFEGAPRTINGVVHAPLLDDRIALGLSVASDRLGVTNQNTIAGSYAYRIPLKKGKLAFGISAVASIYKARWSQITSQDPNDPAFISDSPNIFSPNFGVGAYYHTDRFYLGASVPHLLNGSLNDNLQYEGTQPVARQYRHYFATTGVVVDLGEEVKMKPSVLVKYVINTPVQADLNLSFLIKDAFWIGASYRTGDAIVGMIEYDFAKRYRLGYAYDFTTTELSNYSAGTHEIMIGYDFINDNKYLTPRRMSYF